MFFKWAGISLSGVVNAFLAKNEHLRNAYAKVLRKETHLLAPTVQRQFRPLAQEIMAVKAGIKPSSIPAGASPGARITGLPKMPAGITIKPKQPPAQSVLQKYRGSLPPRGKHVGEL